MQNGEGGGLNAGKINGNPGQGGTGFSHPKMKVALIIWFAMFLSQAQFYLLSLGGGDQADGILDREVLWLVGGIFMVMSQGVRHVPAFKGNPQKCFTGFVLALAFAEVPAILALLDSMNGGQSAFWLRIMSGVSFAMNFPTMERLGLLQQSSVQINDAKH